MNTLAWWLIACPACFWLIGYCVDTLGEPLLAIVPGGLFAFCLAMGARFVLADIRSLFQEDDD